MPQQRLRRFPPHAQDDLFVTRHAGARDWALAESFVGRFVEHLSPAEVLPGQSVFGTLPADLAAEICSRGARYYHLAITLRRDERGRDFTAAEMRERDARLVRIDARIVREGEANG